MPAPSSFKFDTPSDSMIHHLLAVKPPAHLPTARQVQRARHNASHVFALGLHLHKLNGNWRIKVQLSAENQDECDTTQARSVLLQTQYTELSTAEIPQAANARLAHSQTQQASQIAVQAIKTELRDFDSKREKVVLKLSDIVATNFPGAATDELIIGSRTSRECGLR